MAGQVVNYLTGEDSNVVHGQTSPEARAIIEQIRSDVPETAANLISKPA